MLSNISSLGKWWKTWGTLPVWSWVKAASLYRDGKYERARVHYEQGLKRYPDHPAHFCARLDLAYCLFVGRRLEESERHLRYVTSNLPSKDAYRRLARLQLWSGQGLEAAWTIRRALRAMSPDVDLVSLFLISVLENEGPEYLLSEAVAAFNQLSSEDQNNSKLCTARALLDIRQGKQAAGFEALEKLTRESQPPFDALLAIAEVMLSNGRIAEARYYLRRAMGQSPDYPRLLSLMAETYLVAGPLANSEYAKQLATTACQNTCWLSPRELHVLAKSYSAVGDKMAALIIASKAQQAGSRLMGEYRESDSLKRMIDDLSSGSIA